jgi:hypothetical protein
MYCPKCGQQAADNLRFCSRCGLPISDVAEWLLGGTTLVVPGAPRARLSPKRKSMRLGAKIMFWGVVLTPIFAALSVPTDSPLPLFVPCLIFLAGLSLWLYYRLFGEELPFADFQPEHTGQLGTVAVNGTLPPARGDVVGSNVRQVKTAEMIHPPSVTDHTTKLLDQE